MDTDRRILENTQWHTFHFQSEDDHTQATKPSLKDESIPSPIIEEEVQQQQQNIPATVISTTTTATLQQYRLSLTKTFEDTSSQTNSHNSNDIDDDTLYETRTSVLLEQMASLHGQLNNMLPTRSYYSATSLSPTDTGSHPSIISSSSCSSSLSSPYSSPFTNDGWEDNIKSIDGLSTTSSTSSSMNHHHNGEVVFLHPLQAAQEDMNLYESNLNTLKQQADLITEEMKWVREQHLRIMNTTTTTNLITNNHNDNDNDDDDNNNNNNNNNNQQQDINSQLHDDNDDNNNQEEKNDDDDDVDDHDKQNQEDNNMNTHDDTLIVATTTDNNNNNNNNNNNQQLTFHQQKKVARVSQMEQAYVSLMHRMEQAEKQYLAFHQGFNFSQACHGIRAALNSIQTKMMQKTTTDHDVLALEESIASTSHQLILVRDQYCDLLLNKNDPKYDQRWKSIHHKNEIVKTWVEEVKVWFAEAERIRTWIDERRNQLEETNLPDPLAPLLHEDKPDHNEDVPLHFITKEDLEKSHAWKEKHQLLEKEMETFDQQDMARLRSHVKALTGGKDLSPADTTTIEITLTTLTTLDKVMHTLRDKSHKLLLLTQRSLWEKEYETTMAWLHTTENEVDTFLGQARWTLNNQRNMDKSTFIDGLVQLERKLSDFDKKQFSTTVDLYQDLDDTAQVDLPHYLEHRQMNCEQFFEDLFKRLAFARSVVEQRLELMDFMVIIQHVFDDANQLLIDLKQTCSFSNTTSFSNDNDNDNDDEVFWADRVQDMQERIISLASAQRISYPMVTLSIDQEDNEFANQLIRQHVTQQRTSLVLLGESVDEQWQALRHRWQLRHNLNDMMVEANKWKAWADERLRQINENHQLLLEQQEKLVNKSQPKNKNFLNMIASALDQINHWERTVSIIKSKLVTKETNIDGFMNRSVQLKQNIYQVNTDSTDSACITILNHALDGMNISYQDLRHLLNEHQQALEQFKHDLEQDSHIIDIRNELWNFVHTLRTSLPNLKQTCGFMTGHSQSQDKERFDTLSQRYHEWRHQLQKKQDLYNQWHHDVQQEHQQEDEQRKNDDLIVEWDTLVNELKDLGTFQDEVHKWYDRQRKLSLVEHALSLFNNTNNNGDDDSLESATIDDDHMIQVGLQQQAILKNIGETIQLGSGKGGAIMDPLQTANYSCARERYQTLMTKAQQLVKDGEERKKQKENSIQLQQYKDQVHAFINLLQSDRDMILERIIQQRSQAWAFTIDHNPNALTTLLRTAQQATQTMDAQVQHHYRVQQDNLRKNKNKILLSQLSIMNNNNSNNNDSNENDDTDDQQIKMGMDELEKAITLEKRQINIFKHLYAYAKAAMELDQWLVHGNTALLQLTNDIGVIDEVDILATLTRFETKLDNIQPTLQGFQRMHDKIMMMADENDKLDSGFKSQMNFSFSKIQQGFNNMKYQLNDIQHSMYRHKQHASIARKMKDILQMIGNYRDRVTNIKLYSDQQQQHQQYQSPSSQKIDDDDDDHEEKEKEKDIDNDKENMIDCLTSALKTCSLSSIPTNHDIESTRNELDKLEQDIQLHLDTVLQDLDEALKNEQKENGDDIFTDQRKEITQAITELQQSIKDKRYWLNEAEKLENVLTVLDEWEVLLSALVEVVHRASLSETSQYSRADLQAMLIDLDTRYKYYEPNILSLVKEAQLVMMDIEDIRLINFYNQLTEQWQQLRRLALEKKNIIISKIGPAADPLVLSHLYDVLPNNRQHLQKRSVPLTSSISTLTTSTTVHSIHSLDKPLLRKSSFPTRTTTTTTARGGRPRTITPNPLNATAPRLMTAERALKRSSWHQQQHKHRQSSSSFNNNNNPKNTYVADPKNDLDVAVGNIVNDSPFSIPVKMVPGEVGRYWFGKKNPKLVYCRILRSRIVMVRVGGGWVELSQFLRDHALLEEGRFTSTKGQRLAAESSIVNDSNDTITTTTIMTDKKKKRYSQPLENSTDINNNQPVLRHSRSTPFQPSSYYCYSARGHSPIPSTHGIKEGNKFVVTDDDGKQVQVTMTKAKNKQSSKYKAPWR